MKKQDEEGDEPEVDAEPEPLPKGCTLNQDGSVTIVLEYPFTYGKGGEKIAQLMMRRPNTGAMRLLNLAEDKMISSLVDIAGKCCGQPPTAMNMIDGSDLKKILKVVSRFLPSSLPSGGA